MAIDPKDVLAGAVSVVQETATQVRDKATELGGKAADAATDVVIQANETLAAAQRKMQLDRYKPVFPDEYDAPDYDRPKMIVIEDEDERKGIEVCEGSIGWFGKAAGLEVLHLYEEAVPSSGIAFFPRAICNSVYFEDTLTPGRYISLDCYFDVLEKDKITELRRIAYELGAKRCTLESVEEAKTVRIGKGDANIGSKSKKGTSSARKGDSGKAKRVVATTDASAQASLTLDEGVERRIVFEQTFEGNANPRHPELKWFAHDQEIEFLINTRCNDDGSNKTKEYRMQLDSKALQTMTVSLAARIDRALGRLGAACNFSLEGEALTESRKKLVFEVKF